MGEYADMAIEAEEERLLNGEYPDDCEPRPVPIRIRAIKAARRLALRMLEAAAVRLMAGRRRS